MNIIYIQRDETANLPWVVKRLKRIKNYLYASDQDGFFEHSLQSVSQQHTVRFMYLHTFQTQPLPEDTDAVIINMKCTIFKDANERKTFFREFLHDKPDIMRCLFLNTAQASYMFEDAVLDNFDVVFKREPYRDRNRYTVSARNKAKIVPTMIHCPFVYAARNNRLARFVAAIRPLVSACQSGEETYEVGFSGVDASTHTLRRDAWQAVIDAGFTTIGGLQPNPHSTTPLPNQLIGPRLSGRAYRAALCQAKINLALDGIGEYTFRHQELFFLGKFVLSSPSIREVELPFPIVEGVHYVAFEDISDMVDKIRYYLAHDDERAKIAAAGHKLFLEYYNPRRHANAIIDAINKVKLTRSLR